ncbi:hypothetical protein PRJ_4863 [Pseudomonas sp. XWY-1]|nr:hypothetical protein PRJ_4863 [Pseudomonas sp. XWY-1]
MPPLPYSRVNPLLRTDRGWTHIGDWPQAACRSGFTREEAGLAGQLPPAVHRCRRYRIRG